MSGEKFGKYILLNPMGKGGMAEVYRGRLTGQEGFEKQVVIKKMLPKTAENPEMVRYFIDEARLAALLQHENIVHVYDFGEADGAYFMAMEYLSGNDLSEIIRQVISRGESFSVETVLWIASKVCDGLEYAHTLKNLEGEPLNLIHRDLSPHNLFITRDGKVKILDFGIAKTTMQSTETQIGIAKGKMAYMSPEQIEAKTLDHRSDIFAIGILMYEMLTLRRMFKGDSTVDVFRQVMEAAHEPIDMVLPDLEPEVAAIIEKALSKSPDDRFSSCLEMQQVIEDCLFRQSMRPDAKALSLFMTELFPGIDDKDESAAKPDETLAETIALGAEVEKTVAETIPAVEKPSETEHAELDLIPDKTSPPDLFQQMFKGPSGKRNLIIAGVTGSILSLVLIALLLVISGSLSTEERLLLDKAETCITKSQLTKPAKANAFFYYSELVKVKPDNGLVREFGDKLVEKLTEQAERAYKQLEINSARNYVEKGLKLKPDEPRLLSLQAELSKSKPDLILKNIGDGFRKVFK